MCLVMISAWWHCFAASKICHSLIQIILAILLVNICIFFSLFANKVYQIESVVLGKLYCSSHKEQDLHPWIWLTKKLQNAFRKYSFIWSISNWKLCIQLGDLNNFALSFDSVMWLDILVLSVRCLRQTRGAPTIVIEELSLTYDLNSTFSYPKKIIKSYILLWNIMYGF